MKWIPILKNATGVDIWKCHKIGDLASLKSETDKLDIGKLGTTLVDLIKLGHIVKNKAVKKTIQTNHTSSLVKKADYNIEISKIEKKILHNDHEKYITTQHFNKFTAETFAARLKQANLAIKTDIADFVKKKDFDYKQKK